MNEAESIGASDASLLANIAASGTVPIQKERGSLDVVVARHHADAAKAKQASWGNPILLRSLTPK